MTKKVAIFISGSGSNMVSLVNSMYKQNFAWPSLVLSNKSCAIGLTKAKNFNIPTVCIEPKKASGIDLDFETEIQSCLLYTSPSPRDDELSRMPSSA